MASPMMRQSEALPFLTRRASLGPKGALVGDVGFDPLGFTEIFPLVRALFLAPVPPDHSRTPLSKQRARKFRRGCSGDGGASACSTSSARQRHGSARQHEQLSLVSRKKKHNTNRCFIKF